MTNGRKTQPRRAKTKERANAPAAAEPFQYSVSASSYPPGRKHAPPVGFPGIQRKRPPRKEKPYAPWRQSPEYGIADVPWYFREYASFAHAAAAWVVGLGKHYPHKDSIKDVVANGIKQVGRGQTPSEEMYRAALKAMIQTAVPGAWRPRHDVFSVLLPLLYVHAAADGVFLPGLPHILGVVAETPLGLEAVVRPLEKPVPSLREVLGVPTADARRIDLAAFAHDWGITFGEGAALAQAAQACPGDAEIQLRELLIAKRGKKVVRDGDRGADQKPRKRRVDPKVTKAEVQGAASRAYYDTGLKHGSTMQAIREVAKRQGVSESAIKKRLWRKPRRGAGTPCPSG